MPTKASKADLINKAQKLIAAGDIRWYDYCAETGQAAGNIDHLRGNAKAFAKYLWPDEWAAAT